MGWYAGAAVAGQVIGGYFQSQGAQSAAQQQAAAAQQAAATQQQTLQQQLALTKPWQEAGTQALGQLQAGFGAGGQFAQPFTMGQAINSPAEQVAQKQSLEAMRNQMQLGGQNLSTNAIVGAGQNAANIAGQFENQAFQQWMLQQQQQIGGLQNIAGLGANATGAASSAMGTTGQNVGSLQMGAGNALAAGTAGQYNAYGNAATGISQNLGQMYMLNSILGQGGGGATSNVASNTASQAGSQFGQLAATGANTTSFFGGP